MVVVLVFSLTLLAGVLTSALAQRSILSTAVLFLFAGFVSGEGVFGAISFSPQNDAVVLLTELALFTVLFTDAMKAGFSDLKSTWHLPGRALLFGMPLTMTATALLARFIAGLSWDESFLLGAY